MTESRPRLACSWCFVPGDRHLERIGDKCEECGTVLLEITDEGPPYGIVKTTGKKK